MKTKTNPLFLVLNIMIGLGILSCENLTPTQNESEAQLITTGISADQLNFVEWNPEVIQALRAVSDEDESNSVARWRGDISIAGAEVKLANTYWETTIGGEKTFGNSVYIPPGAIAENRYIAVQAVCAEADENAVFENGTAYIAEIKSSMNNLIIDMGANWWAAQTIATALDQLEQAEVFFQLYSYYASPSAFSKLDWNVSRQMNTLVWWIEHDYLDASYFDQIQNIAELTVATSRDLALSATIYAEQVPGADASKIGQAYDGIDVGDMQAATRSNFYALEWYNYDSAIRKYSDAWKKAIQAIHNLDAPCGASVDFLPSQQFEANVTVTLSWEALNFDGNPDELEVYWFNDDTDLWVLVPDPVIDYVNGTVSVNIDHFTRYAWVNPPPPTD